MCEGVWLATKGQRENFFAAFLNLRESQMLSRCKFQRFALAAMPDYLMGEFNGGCTTADGCREQPLLAASAAAACQAARRYSPMSEHAPCSSAGEPADSF